MLSQRFINIAIFATVSGFAPYLSAEEAQGGLFVEPAVTYEVGNSSVNYPEPFSNSTGTTSGLGIGARVGFHLQESFFLGVDLRYGFPQFKDSSVDYNARSISTNWGPVVGMQMPNLGMRLWGSFILGGELNPDKSGSFDIKFLKGSGYRVGAGFRVAAISLNLEYQELKYGQAKLEQLGPFASGALFDNVKLENKTWLASVSFPLQL
jgi:hypothetical protein